MELPELPRDAELNVYIKDGEQFRFLKLDFYTVKKPLNNRLIDRDIERLHKLADSAQLPTVLGPKTVVVDFNAKTARLFDVKMRLDWLETPWSIQVEKMTLQNYEAT